MANIVLAPLLYDLRNIKTNYHCTRASKSGVHFHFQKMCGSNKEGKIFLPDFCHLRDRVFEQFISIKNNSHFV